MASRARKNPTPRTWPTETPYTARVCVRMPIEVRNALRRYAEENAKTTTESVVAAVKDYLSKRGY